MFTVSNQNYSLINYSIKKKLTLIHYSYLIQKIHLIIIYIIYYIIYPVYWPCFRWRLVPGFYAELSAPLPMPPPTPSILLMTGKLMVPWYSRISLCATIIVFHSWINFGSYVCIICMLATFTRCILLISQKHF